MCDRQRRPDPREHPGLGAEQNSTVAFPMPIDSIKPFLELLEKAGKAPGANGATRVPLMKGVPLAV